jgi:hypothetical protein
MSKSPMPCSTQVVQTQTRVHQGSLSAAEHAVDARHLPLAAREVDRRADLAPVVPRCVGGMDHLGVLLARAVRRPDQRPYVVEEVDRQLPPRGVIDRSCVGVCHRPSFVTWYRTHRIVA